MLLLPLCKCGSTASEKTVMKEGPNKGKAFFSCHLPFGNATNCGFFMWREEWIANLAGKEPTVKYVRAPKPEVNVVVNAGSVKVDSIFATRTSPASSQAISKPTFTKSSYIEKKPRNDPVMNKMVLPIPQCIMEPTEQHDVHYNLLMNNSYQIESYGHVQRFSESMKNHGYNVEKCSLYELVHLFKHLYLGRGHFNEEEDWSVWIQPSLSASIKIHSGLENNSKHPTIKLQIHGPQKTNLGWLNCGKASKIAYEFGECFVILDRNMLRKFLVMFMDDGPPQVANRNTVTTSPKSKTTSLAIEKMHSDDVEWENVMYSHYGTNGNLFEKNVFVYLKHVLHYFNGEKPLIHKTDDNPWIQIIAKKNNPK